MLLNSRGPQGRLRALSQALATLIGAPPLWDVGFLPTHMPTSLWVGQSWVPGHRIQSLWLLTLT